MNPGAGENDLAKFSARVAVGATPPLYSGGKTIPLEGG